MSKSKKSNKNSQNGNKDRYDPKRAADRTEQDAHPRADDGKRYQEQKPNGDINDISDYFTPDMEELKNGLNTYSFDSFMGTPIDVGSIGSTHVPATIGNFMVIRINPSATFTSVSGAAANDGINVAGLRNFTLASSENGKTTMYQPQDMTMLTLSYGSILTYLGHITRAFGLVRIYNSSNRMYAWRVLRALGFDPDSLIKHQADLRNRLNYIISRINQIDVPLNIRYFGKCLRMFSSIYKDEEDSPLAQTYAFVPQSLWRLDEAYDSDGSGLRTVDLWSSGAQTMEWHLDTLEAMVNFLLTSSTFNYIYSDFKRLSARGQLNLLKLVEVPEAYRVVPQYSPEIREWINNMIILDIPEADTSKIIAGHTLSNDVKCDVNKNCILYRPQFFVEADWKDFEPFINFTHVDPAIEEKFAATRLRAGCLAISAISGSTNFYQTETTLPDFYATAVILYDGTTDTESGKFVFSFMARYTTGAANITANNNRENARAMLSKFKWHPYVYVIDKLSSGDELATVVGDLQYFTTLAGKKLKNIHDAAMLGQCLIR